MHLEPAKGKSYRKTSFQSVTLRFHVAPFEALVIVFPRAAEMDDEVSDAMLKEVCITEQTQIYYMNNNLSFSRTVDCGNCSR